MYEYYQMPNGLNMNLGDSLMIKYKYYRLIQVIFGARSFKKVGEDGTNTYILIKGKGPRINSVIEQWFADGYVEEWPLEEVHNA
jgi:hypothetical protein